MWSTQLSVRRISISALLMIGTIAVPGNSASRPHAHRANERRTTVGHDRCLKVDVPAGLTLSIDEEGIRVGARVTMNVTIEARRSLVGIGVMLNTEGPVVLNGPAQVNVGTLEEGATSVLRVPVTFTEEGRSVVTVALRATAPATNERVERQQSLYVILEDARVTTGTNGFLLLDLRRVEEDFEAEVIDEEQARALVHDLTAMPVTVDSEPRTFIPPTEQQVELARGLEPRSDPNETYVPDEQPEVDVVQGTNGRRDTGQASGGSITVQGTVSWIHQDGTVHPAFGMTVQVRDDETIGSELVAQAATDVNGQYSFVVDNDDGFLAGNRDIFVRIRTTNSAVSIESDGLFGAPYEADTAVMDEVPDGTVIIQNITAANTGTGPAASLHTGATFVASYAKQLNAGVFLAHLSIQWPGGSSTSDFDGSDIDLLQDDRWDWDVMDHEFGHYVMDVFDFEDNPGNNHNLRDCHTDKRPSKDEGLRLAWGEGWPTFFGTASQQQLNLASLSIPNVGDAAYSDTIDLNSTYSLETQDSMGNGEGNELAVQLLFWDLFDGAVDGKDGVQIGDQTLFNAADSSNATTLSTAWATVRVGLTPAQDLAVGALASDHGIGPDPLSPAANSIAGPGANFTWTPNVGCGGFDGDNFDLVFYHETSLAKLVTISGLTAPARALSLSEYTTLVTATHHVLWAVEGRNSASPATGPYLGDHRALTLNRRPVCNANGPYAAECALPVALNGSGSSDPDGDPLAFTWTGPFAGGSASGATPSVTFGSVGDFTVGLSVSDSIQNATCSSSVMVRDTLPPVIPPSPPPTECTSAAGTPVNLGVPTDLCDPAVSFTNDAPALFPLGSTTVNWTATDASGNQAAGTQTVTVVDTTPPTLSIAASPNVLWPPNHTLRTVQLTVTATDACDETPVLRLVSITSSEPDKDPGDVTDKSHDIQDAKLGSDDRSFRLRAEHSKGGARTYTITYEAEDQSGNVSTAQTLVRVPKSGVTLISRNGRPANGPSATVAINVDGSVVAFSSDATNLVEGDDNELRDVFVRSRGIPVHTERISVSDGEAQANGRSEAPAVNGDGVLVSFASSATNLVANDFNQRRDVFVRDRNAGTTERISVTSSNAEAHGSSNAPSIDRHGRFVAFQSLADDLVSGDTNEAADIFVRDRLNQTTERLCNGTQGDGFSIAPAISADGRFVAFTSAATNLISGDTNERLDVYLCDRAAGTLERVSVSSSGVQGNQDSLLPAISSDGRFVAFKSLASNLVPHDHNGVIDVFVRDRLNGVTERVSVDRFGGDANDASFPPSISDDGRFVAFGSFASDLVSYDTNDVASVFVRDREFATTYLVDVNDNGELANRGVPDSAPAITGDGVQIGFVSPATNLIPNPNNEVNDVFVVCNPALPTPPSATLVTRSLRPREAVALKKSALLKWRSERKDWERFRRGSDVIN